MASSGHEIRDEEKAFIEKYVYRVLWLLAVVLLSTGTVFYHLFEGWSWVDSFYFSSIAVTTVGFGDLVPNSDPAKLFTVFYVFSGIAIITSFLNARLRRHARSVRRAASDRA